ncbi:MAG TPA: chemotaxis protein CheW [Bryobacteraceae bacterium]|nr:chemotaxis protein CheW [Bryobacteraceae bacterium]
MSQRKQFCTFYLDSRLFGVDVLKIQEVLRFQPMTEVPLASAVIRGLLNLRGSIVSTLDLRRRFAMPPLDSDTLPTNVVAQTPSGLISLLVDRIGDVVEVEQADFEPPPETLDATARELIDGVYKLPSGLLLILNVERALELEPARNA